MKAYLRVLRRPAARWSYVAAFVARLPISMTPLSLLILVEGTTGSYAEGGFVSGAYALGAAASAPFWGRALDTGPHRRIVAGTAAASLVFLAASAFGVLQGWSLLPVGLLALGVGLFFPPITPAMRVAWPGLVPDAPESLAAAYALDAVAVEALFVLGPLLVGAASGGGPALPVIVTCLCFAVGGLGYALSPAGNTRGRKLPTGEGQGAPGVILQPAVLLVALVAAAMSVGFGQMDVALTSMAQSISTRGVVLGLMFAAIAGGSIVGGLLFGAREWRWPPHRLLSLSLAGFALGLAGVGLASGRTSAPLLLLPLLTLAGLFISPSLLVMQLSIDRALPPERRAEGQAWLGAVLTAGGAVGMALGGLWADLGPPMTVFLASAATLALGALVASLARGRLGRSSLADPRPAPAKPVPTRH